MTKQKVEEIVEYWQKTASHDYETMVGLFKIKRYSDSLFYGHIVLEKILKAHVVVKIKRQAEYTHNLVKLAEDAKVGLTDLEWNLLGEVNRFNIRTRYPDDKLAFYKQCTKKYTEEYLVKIKSFYNVLCRRLNEKN